MKTTNVLGLVLLALACGCSKEGPTPVPDSAVSPAGAVDANAAPAAEQEYTLDFTALPNGGEHIDRFRHLAFNLLGDPVRKAGSPGIVASNDLVSCDKYTPEKYVSALTRNVEKLPTGGTSFVGTINVALETKDDERLRGGVCYGYRENGEWKWEFTHTVIASIGDHKYVAQIRVNHGPIDAVKLVFDDDVSAAVVTSVKYIARGM